MKEILFVEDNADVRGLFAEHLRAAGFEVVTADLAETALQMLGRRHRAPDLVLLDLGMPPGKMDGMEMLARLRENRAWADIPVIILSGMGEVINRDVTRRLSVKAVLEKMATPGAELVRIARNLLGEPAGEPGGPWSTR